VKHTANLEYSPQKKAVLQFVRTAGDPALADKLLHELAAAEGLRTGGDYTVFVLPSLGATFHDPELKVLAGNEEWWRETAPQMIAGKGPPSNTHVEAFLRHVKAKGMALTCPFCSKREWSVSRTAQFVEEKLAPDGHVSIVGAGVIPLMLVTCRHCYYTATFPWALIKAEQT
jgi:hypothetical protein